MLNFIDLFAGAGGLSEGFIRAGYTPLAYIEMDKYACDTLVTHKNYQIGLTLFPEKRECITTAQKNKSYEIEIFQVIEPNMALGHIKRYSNNLCRL
jgi:site-specific DNA-cytosine methylase